MAERFLGEHGLRLSRGKSWITHIREGFDFLGANIRRYGEKFFMKPAKKSYRGFLRGLKELLKQRQGTSTWKVIQELNRRILGWTQFYRCLVSSRTFRALDSALFDSLWRWIRLRHRNKRARWLSRRYFLSIDGRSWVFSALKPHRSRGGQQSLFPELQGRQVTLVAASSVRICRHVKV